MSESLIETEEALIIETPERVPLDHFIQYFSIFIIVWAALALAGTNFSDARETPSQIFAEMPKWTTAILIFVLFLIFAGYFIVFEWLWNGQTPGKRLLKLRVIREDGRPITLWESIARNLLRIFDAVPGFVLPVYSIGLISIFMSSRDQRVGDVFAGTVVVRERLDEAPTFKETFSNPISDAAFRRVQKPVEFRADVNLLNDGEIQVVESFLRRRWDLTDRQRIWMAWRVALPIMYKLKPDYDLQNFTYEGFLEEIVHRFHERRRFLN
jgi:uncharacterized RDD family membrane protein YckC